jgi:hypothetical protein
MHGGAAALGGIPFGVNRVSAGFGGRARSGRRFWRYRLWVRPAPSTAGREIIEVAV